MDLISNCKVENIQLLNQGFIITCVNQLLNKTGEIVQATSTVVTFLESVKYSIFQFMVSDTKE